MKRNEYGSDFNHVEFDKSKLKISLPENATYFGCGRYAINHLIKQHLNLGLWESIYIPVYFCYDVINSIKKTGINVKYYNDYPLADDNYIISKLDLVEGDVLFRMNFFGIRSFRDNSEINVPVIEDHSHNLFSNWASKSNADWCVASLRKTLPVPDGGILWSPQDHQNLPFTLLTDEHKLLSQTRFDAMLLKYNYLERISDVDKNKYLKYFKETEITFDRNEISSISNISKRIIQNIPKDIDFQKRLNYDYLKSLLKLTNIEVVKVDKVDNPFSLVLLFKSKTDRGIFREYLISANIYPAILWVIENVNGNKEIIKFSERMLSIHIDFRYLKKDMIKMSSIINLGNQVLEDGI